jgi:hypothetical protein
MAMVGFGGGRGFPKSATGKANAQECSFCRYSRSRLRACYALTRGHTRALVKPEARQKYDRTEKHASPRSSAQSFCRFFITPSGRDALVSSDWFRSKGMHVMTKRLIGLVFAGALVFSAAAEVVVRIAPPHAVMERRAPSPGHDYVWTAGYHRWEGNAYVWTPGSLATTSTAPCPMGGAPVDSPTGRLGFSRGPLALAVSGRSKRTALSISAAERIQCGDGPRPGRYSGKLGDHSCRLY